MLKSIFFPSKQNIITWFVSIYLLTLLFMGKVSGLTILFIYFFETIIIGVFNVVKMFLIINIGKKHKKEKGSFRYGIILFFMFHYGFFVAIQSIFGFSMFAAEGSIAIKEPFHLLSNYYLLLSSEGIKFALPVIFFNHMSWFVTGFLREKKYDFFTAQEMMFKPYVRIFVQQFVVIISMFFIIIFKSGLIVGTLLIVIRLCIDLLLEGIKENSKFLDYAAEKLANEKASKEEIKKQLINYTE